MLTEGKRELRQPVKSLTVGENEPLHFVISFAQRIPRGKTNLGSWWVTLRPYVRVTDVDGKPYQKKAITRRRKNVTKSWWNKEWFARNLALIQTLAQGNRFIIVGASGHEVKIDTRPLKWVCPIAIDYEAVARIGDFQQEMAEIRFVAEEDDVEDE